MLIHLAIALFVIAAVFAAGALVYRNNSRSVEARLAALESAAKVASMPAVVPPKAS